MAIGKTASDCGLPPPSLRCVSSCAAQCQMSEASSSCGDDEDDDEDDDQSNPRTAETCASTRRRYRKHGFHALQEMSTGLATCTGPFAGVQADAWRIDSYLRKTASDCGRPPPFSVCAQLVAGAMSKMGEMSSCETTTTMTIIATRTPETCASDACVCFIASMTDDALQEMSTGLATCTGVR